MNTFSAVAVAAAAYGLYELYKRLKRPKSVKLTYFDLRGLPGEKLRYALALTGTPFEDNRVKFDDWQALKPKTKYGVLPIIEIDGVEYSQSDSILRWIATLGDGSLYPASLRMKVDEMLGVSDDIRGAFAPGLYLGMRPEVYGYTKETAPVKMIREKFMAEQFGKYVGFVEKELAQTGAFICGVRGMRTWSMHWMAS